MAATLELECPSCQETLELDAGFAGGVCRCSNCGTLMTVPTDSARGHAERLSRPEAPGGGRPESPAKGGRRPGSPDEPPQPSTEAAEAEAGAQSGMDVYVTDEGRVVQVEERTSIPTAPKKRMIVRATTALVFMAVIAAVVTAILIVGLMLLPEHAKKVEPVNIELQQFPFKRDSNPWELEAPNVLGMSLGAKTVVIVDAGKSSKPWLGMVNDAVAAGLDGANSGAKLNLLYATNDGVKSFASSLWAVSSFTQSNVSDFTKPITAGGQPQLRTAIDAAIEYQPEQILLVIGDPLTSDQIDQLKDILGGQKDLIFDILSIDQDSPAMEDLALDHAGRYELLSTRTIKQWQTNAQARTHSEAEAEAKSKSEG